MIAAPLIVVECHVDVGIYDSVADVLAQLEAIDVRRGDYVAYDADGRLLRLFVEQDRVGLSVAEDEPTHRHELEAILRNYLVAIGMPDALAYGALLPQLLSECARYARPVTTFRQVLRNIFGGRRVLKWEPGE